MPAPLKMILVYIQFELHGIQTSHLRGMLLFEGFDSLVSNLEHISNCSLALHNVVTFSNESTKCITFNYSSKKMMHQVGQ